MSKQIEIIIEKVMKGSESGKDFVTNYYVNGQIKHLSRTCSNLIEKVKSYIYNF